MQSQFTYLNQYQHSLAQYAQVSNQAWTHMFTDYARALYVDTSAWPAISSFQPPPTPPMALEEGNKAMNEKEAAFAADDIEKDL